MRRRVVITGIGMVTPLANTAEASWRLACGGISGVGTITRFDASGFSCSIAGEVRRFDVHAYMTPKEAARTDPFIQYALAAAVAAREDAERGSRLQAGHRAGVLVGSGRGGVSTFEKNHAALLARGPRSVSPFLPPMSLVNMASGFLAMKLKATGPCLDVSTACATGTHAVGEAMKIIQRGDADIMFAGGAEAALTPLVLAGFCQARALSLRNGQPERASRPFDRDRDGFVLSEGAGVLVLEELGTALRRNAQIYAELAGYGISADAHHVTLPNPSGLGSCRAMELALADAGMIRDEIDYLNAHGTATRSNDRIETLAIKQAFGDHAKRLAVSSVKSMLGHMLGAAGAVEAGTTALALRDGVIPPTINLDSPDPECDLDCVAHTARKGELTAALSNSLGFGGMNAALVLRKYTS